MGPSGVGKTVTIKMLVGLLTPDSGDIIFDGMHYSHFRREKDFLEIRKRISMVFQGAALFDSLNVFDNIAYPLRLHQNLSAEELNDKVNEKLTWVGLPDAAQKMPSEISGGMKKRIGLARAIAMDPEVILYDEPSAGLDPVNTARISDLIVNLNERLNCTSVVVTHDIPFADRLNGRVGFLYGGKIAAIGTVDSLTNNDDELIRGFMRGDPSLVDAYDSRK